MAVEISPADLFLPAFTEGQENRAYELISTVIARAAQFAPCILTDDLTPAAKLAAKGILVDVITRRFDRSIQPGVNVTKAMGARSISVDGSGVPSVPFFPAEILELQGLCSAASASNGASLPVYSFPDAQPWPC